MPRHLALVIPSLMGGGAERMAAAMAEHWTSRGDIVTVITTESPDTDFYTLEPAIRRVSLHLPAPPPKARVAVLRFVARVVAKLRRELRAARPDAIISMLEVMNVMTLLATRGTGVPVAVNEQADPRFHALSGPWRRARRTLYPRADGVVVLTNTVAAWARTFVPEQRVFVIPNALCVAPPLPAPPRTDGRRTIAGMGRLLPVKGFDLLLQAMARLANHHPEWDLEILGDGPERHRLERLAAELGIAERVRFRGMVHDPLPTIGQADLFVMASRHEGFCNAIVEAMACGLPVISTDCSGPSAIVRHDVDGLLIAREDVGAMAAAMGRLMGSAETRARLATRAPEVVERFALPRIMGMWDEVVTRMLRGARAEQTAGTA